MSRTSHCDHCVGSHTGERSCLATATATARSWLLIEHPGPWPERIEQLTGPAPLVAVIERAARAGVRPQLIRRPGRGRRPTPPLQVYLGGSLGGPVWLEGRTLGDHRELEELDEGVLAEVAAGRRPRFGEPVAGPAGAPGKPLLLVCTHGKRNACCARYGAPLARELAARFGDLVWETTHVGGDRYAANLVCLPHGLYYGDLGAAEAASAVESYLRGEVALERLRGRAGLPAPAQAAEHHVRVLTGVLGVDSVSVESLTGTSPYEAVIDVAGARYLVTVEETEPVHDCEPGCQENVRSYVVRGITLLNRAALV
ncbi:MULTISPECIES: sucrase ferredoxin [Thermomonospora]|uniref:Sucraseferredoxin family protein n=1 Tax=Thermomonospora curvata (strain ATCC 19995 / DSM 43183 / JCM 3096 / KCTC 9072 / NBRC 15933 / NCIMB 10081 / Henssen B9) TaxID=471852 RepID=D1ACN0_THECD|nr:MULTISPECIES: sucrase ferredoxin [Thermomonospora]ACY97369.1 Sucraseferredoxin family protein [Thermomonospora curvata DSM 43183]PKK14728.1 MAG: sucrase ferredoxin [Thermomonospora sp. CIF 1]